MNPTEQELAAAREIIDYLKHSWESQTTDRDSVATIIHKHNAELKEENERLAQLVSNNFDVALDIGELKQQRDQLSARVMELELSVALWDACFSRYSSWLANKAPAKDWPASVVADYKKCSDATKHHWMKSQGEK